MNGQELIQCVKRQKALSNESGMIENKKALSEELNSEVEAWLAKGGKIKDLNMAQRFHVETFNGNTQQKTKRVRLSGEARREAQKKGEIFYHGQECALCKGTQRYVQNMNCVACNRRRAAQRGKGKVQRVVGGMA